MSFREYLQVLHERGEDAPVGTVRIRGQSRVQKQRNGEWLRLGPVRPGEAPPPKLNPNALALPPSRKRSPAVEEIPIPINRKWEDSSPDMPEKTTDDQFKEDQPRPARKPLHERIFRTFIKHVDEVPADKMPVAVLMMGGPISGRSAAVKNLTHDALFVRIDPGVIATMLPEYKEAIKKLARNAAAICQEEAAYIAHRLLEEALNERKNVAIDAVGVDADAHLQLLQDLTDAGYYTVLVLTDMDRADAIKRNKDRGSKTGLWVPREALALGKVAAKNFEEIEDEADESLRIDVRGAPKHVTEVLEDLQTLLEQDDEEDEEPTEPAVTVTEIRKRVLEGLRKEKVRMTTLPEQYKPSEGVLLAHYDDAHIQPIDFGDDEEEPDDGGDSEEPEDDGEEA